MKVAFVISTLHAGGGAERNTCYLASELRRRGHEVTVFVLSADISVGYAIDPKVKVEAVPLGWIRRGAPAFLARLVYLRRRLATFDVCVGIMVTSNVLTALACWGLSTRSFAAERTSPEAYPQQRSWRLLRGLTYRLHSGVIAQTERAAEWLRSHAGIRRVIAIPNPQISSTSSLPTQIPEALVEPQETLVLAVGRLVPQKGFDRLIPILAKTMCGRPRLKAVILGEGDERNRLEAQVAEVGLTGRILLPGQAGNVHDWYRRADIFVMSSRFEGYPNALMEARSHGTPAIAFDCPEGPAEIVTDGVDGFIVPDDDAARFERRLATLVDDNILREEFGRNGARMAQSASNEKILEAWLGVLTKP